MTIRNGCNFVCNIMSKPSFSTPISYIAVGKNTLFCGVNGWEGRPPVCEGWLSYLSISHTRFKAQGFYSDRYPFHFAVIMCESPPAVVDGSFSDMKDIYSYSETVRYTCKSGFIINGSSQLTCSDNGEFKPNPPQCISKCLKLLQTTFFTIRTAEKVIFDNGNVHFPISVLAEVRCKDPEIPNGFWSGGAQPPYEFSSTVTLKCNSGYLMIGNPVQKCEMNSQWWPGLPSCTRKS